MEQKLSHMNEEQIFQLMQNPDVTVSSVADAIIKDA